MFAHLATVCIALIFAVGIAVCALPLPTSDEDGDQSGSPRQFP